jgi:hypothetical protein
LQSAGEAGENRADQALQRRKPLVQRRAGQIQRKFSQDRVEFLSIDGCTFQGAGELRAKASRQPLQAFKRIEEGLGIRLDRDGNVWIWHIITPDRQ